MPYHLDTDICAAGMRGVPKVRDQIRARAGDPYVSTVVLGEPYCGALLSQRVEKNLAVTSRSDHYSKGIFGIRASQPVTSSRRRSREHLGRRGETMLRVGRQEISPI